MTFLRNGTKRSPSSQMAKANLELSQRNATRLFLERQIVPSGFGGRGAELEGGYLMKVVLHMMDRSMLMLQ